MLFDKKNSKNWLFCKGYPLCFFVKNQEKMLKFHAQKNLLLFKIEKHRRYPFQNLEFSLSPTINILNWFAFIPRAKWCFSDFCNYNSLIIYQVKKYCLIMLVYHLCNFVLRIEKYMLLANHYMPAAGADFVGVISSSP